MKTECAVITAAGVPTLLYFALNAVLLTLVTAVLEQSTLNQKPTQNFQTPELFASTPIHLLKKVNWKKN